MIGGDGGGGGDAAGGAGLVAEGLQHSSASAAAVALLGTASPEDCRRVVEEAEKEVLLEKALLEAREEVERLAERAARADEERRRCLEATRNLKGLIQIMGRVRPPLPGEENDVGCLRVISGQQLEVLTEPRALLTEQFLRHRRRTTGGIRDPAGCKSASTLSEAVDISQGDIQGGVAGNSPPAEKLEPRVFAFDQLFGADASDDAVFAAVRDEIAAAVDGEAVCVLAYGATGSGKTHTVVNLAERAAAELERQAHSLAKGGVRLEITVQLVEIYNEHLRDLLAGDGTAEPPRLKLSVSSSSAQLQGAALRTITAERGRGIRHGLEEVLRIGQAQRATSSTAVHGRSSRSHLVMTLFLALHDAASGSLQRAGKLSLVDLAGSERLKRSEAVGERLREAQNINRSLSALADVISAKERRVAFVPYRNSKLTHLLQDALGGQQHCRTVVIVALPPTRSSLSDTLHSLQFSSRLTALSLPTVVARRSWSTLDHRLKRPNSPSSPRAPAGSDDNELGKEAAKLRAELAQMNDKLSDAKLEIVEKDRLLEEVQKQNEELRASTEVFERSQGQLFRGFAALHQRLQDVEATTLQGEVLLALASPGASPRLAAAPAPAPAAAEPHQVVPTKVAPSTRSSGAPTLAHERGSALRGSGGRFPSPTSSAASTSASVTAAGGPVFLPSPLAAAAESGQHQEDSAHTRGRRASPPPAATRSGSGGVLARRIQPVLRTSRSAVYEPQLSTHRRAELRVGDRQRSPSGEQRDQRVRGGSAPGRVRRFQSPRGRRPREGSASEQSSRQQPQQPQQHHNMLGLIEWPAASVSPGRRAGPVVSGSPPASYAFSAQATSTPPAQRRKGSRAPSPEAAAGGAAARRGPREAPPEATPTPTPVRRRGAGGSEQELLTQRPGATGSPSPVAAGAAAASRWSSPPPKAKGTKASSTAPGTARLPTPKAMEKVQVVPLTPLAPHHLESFCESSRRSTPAPPDEASGPSLAAVFPGASPRGASPAASTSRRHGGHRSSSRQGRSRTPPKYSLEVLTPERVKELFGPERGLLRGSQATLQQLCLPGTSADEEDAGSDGQAPPKSPAMLLCPDLETSSATGDEEASSGGGVGRLERARSPSSVSTSSDEGEIRDRLKQSLQLRGVVCGEPDGLAAAATAAAAAAVAAVVKSAPPAQASRRAAAAAGAASPSSPRGQWFDAAAPTPAWAAPRVPSPAPAASGATGSGAPAVRRPGGPSSSSTHRSAPQPQRQYAPVLSRRRGA